MSTEKRTTYTTLEQLTARVLREKRTTYTTLEQLTARVLREATYDSSYAGTTKYTLEHRPQWLPNGGLAAREWHLEPNGAGGWRSTNWIFVEGELLTVLERVFAGQTARREQYDYRKDWFTLKGICLRAGVPQLNEQIAAVKKAEKLTQAKQRRNRQRYQVIDAARTYFGKTTGPTLNWLNQPEGPGEDGLDEILKGNPALADAISQAAVALQTVVRYALASVEG